LRWRHRLGPVQIAGRLGMAASTVHAVLVRSWPGRAKPRVERHAVVTATVSETASNADSRHAGHWLSAHRATSIYYSTYQTCRLVSAWA
ncbi:hypothetical protein AB0F99_29480, partial [Nocardia testacea]